MHILCRPDDIAFCALLRYLDYLSVACLSVKILICLFRLPVCLSVCIYICLLFCLSNIVFDSQTVNTCLMMYSTVNFSKQIKLNSYDLFIKSVQLTVQLDLQIVSQYPGLYILPFY